MITCFELHGKGKPNKKRFNHRNELLFGTSVILAAFPLEGRKYQQEVQESLHFFIIFQINALLHGNCFVRELK